MSEKKYVNGLYIKSPSDRAPDWVMGKLSINVSQFREWMQGHLRDNPGAEWINIEMTRQKKDPSKGSAVLDEWKPEQKAEPKYPEADDQIPF